MHFAQNENVTLHRTFQRRLLQRNSNTGTVMLILDYMTLHNNSLKILLKFSMINVKAF